ncbi:MAG: hypothetical protein B1H13_09390 [Desulfobacteraceae bacterium 4484_190.3]|nr:MAG: hypothetical protein B1H13_09390 [Desulfobacteraceae bacterium 4484_190.3]
MISLIRITAENFDRFVQEILAIERVSFPSPWTCEGLGRMLIDRMITAGICEGIDCVFLEVRPSNTPARKLYRQVGFREVGRRAKYYSDTGEDAILMALQLNSGGNTGTLTTVYTLS